MIVIDDVASWFVTAFNADATLSTLVPGLVVAERPNEFAEMPYGMCSVELDTEVKWSSGPRNYADYRLTVNIYADQNTAANATAIQRRFEYLFQLIPQVSLDLPDSVGKVISCKVNAASAKFDPRPRNANDVVVCKFGRLLHCSGGTSS